MDSNLLARIQEDIDYILEHEDGLSRQDKDELNKLLKEKKRHEVALEELELSLQKIVDKSL